jgi:gliding motility-associated-like protein
LAGTEWEIEVLNVQNGQPPYLYSINEEPFQETPQFVDLGPGSYRVRLKDQSGCEYEESFELEGRPKLNVLLDAPSEAILGDTLVVRQSTNRPVVNYAWSPTEGLSCTDCSMPILRPLNNTTYILEVTDENGCTARDSFFVQVTKNRNFYAPNIFSPNGDGVNDFFMPFFGNDVARIENFRVFSRWGSLLFERKEALPNSVDLGWNGRTNGEVLPSEVYVWTANIVFIDGASVRASGDVMLLR